MSRILVTGCAGFIGSRVAEKLLDDGYSVLGWDNLNDAYDVRLKQWRLDHLLRRAEFEFERVDISNCGAVRERARHLKLDAVMHLAARAGVRQSLEDPWAYTSTNVIGTVNMLEMCRGREIPRFILASSSSVYGSATELPCREASDTTQPLSPYAASKKAAELMAYSYHHLYGLHTTSLRFFTVYGPAGRPDMSPFRFTQRIAEGRPLVVFGDGSQSRDFTYIDDIAGGVVASLRLTGANTLNLGCDRPVALMDSIRIMEKCLDRAAVLEFRPAHSADVRDTWADNSLARERLGWVPTVRIEDGIERLVSWYQHNREWAREVSTD